MKRWIVLAAVLAVAGCLAGCKSTGPKDFNEAMAFLEQAQGLAEKHGVAWYADVTFDGSPRFYETASVGLDTGIEVRIHFQGNAGIMGVQP